MTTAKSIAAWQAKMNAEFAKIMVTAKRIDAKFKAKGYRLVPQDTRERDIYLEERANCL
jgi:hypothetical protein